MDGTAHSTIGFFQTDDFGVVDRLDPTALPYGSASAPARGGLESESIVTSFYRVILPVWPDHSAYVITASDGSQRRIKLALQKKSVLLGYLRAPLWFFAIGCLAPVVFATDSWTALLVPGVALAVLAAVFTFVAGRLPQAERLRRQQLRRVVGFGAPPELLPDALCAEVRTHLHVMWDTRSPGTDWRDAIESGETSELLVAMAEYHRDPEVIAQAHANFDKKLWN